MGLIFVKIAFVVIGVVLGLLITGVAASLSTKVKGDEVTRAGVLIFSVYAGLAVWITLMAYIADTLLG